MLASVSGDHSERRLFRGHSLTRGSDVQTIRVNRGLHVRHRKSSIKAPRLKALTFCCPNATAIHSDSLRACRKTRQARKTSIGLRCIDNVDGLWGDAVVRQDYL